MVKCENIVYIAKIRRIKLRKYKIDCTKEGDSFKSQYLVVIKNINKLKSQTDKQTNNYLLTMMHIKN